MSSSRRALVGIGAILTVFFFAGCAAGESDVPLLDEPRTDGDALPRVMAEGSDLAPDTARSAGRFADFDIYVAKDVTGDKRCLVAYQTDEQWVSGCGLPGLPFSVGIRGTSVSVDPAGRCEGWTEVAEMICAR